MKVMSVMRQEEKWVSTTSDIKIGDRIRLDEHYTATCMKVGKHGAIFLMDQYLQTKMSRYNIREYLDGFIDSETFDAIRDLMIPFKNGDYLRIPTVEEFFGPAMIDEYHYVRLSNKKQWPLMRDIHYRIASCRCAAANPTFLSVWGWLQNGHDLDQARFACVTGAGQPNHLLGENANGVRVVFRLRFDKEETIKEEK